MLFRYFPTPHYLLQVGAPVYALPAWFGQLTQLDIGRINGLFRKAHRWQLSGRVYTVEQLAGTADAGLFKVIASNPNHSLYQILPQGLIFRVYSQGRAWR